ncbi:MAG: PIG-L deacetylase family protein [Anaerolineae bacterium]
MKRFWQGKGAVPGRRRNLWRALALVLILALALAFGLNLYFSYACSLPAPFVDELPDREAIHRLLVVAPHCDDEAIAAGALIRWVLLNGGQVRVVIVSNGDGSLTGTMVEFRRLYPRTADYWRSGIVRQSESLKAMAALGVPPQDVFFLGYPDRGILPLWQTYWNDERPYRSPYTRLERSSYPLTYNPQAVYSGHSLLSDLHSILEDFQPDTVVAPHPADTHLDHWAVGAFVALAVSAAEDLPQPRLLLYLVHRADYPLPRGHLLFAPLLPPLRLVDSTSTWYRVTYPDEIVAAKDQAVAAYRSQMPLLGDFLRSFVRQNELFCQLAPAPMPALAADQGLDPRADHWQLAGEGELLPLAEDSVNDTLSQRVGAGGDFAALYAAGKGDELWLSLRMQGGPSRVVAYSCFLRSANSREIGKGRVLYPPRLGARPRSEARANFLFVRFSLADLGWPHTAIVSCEARYPGGYTVDRIGWAILRIAP